ncbi:hypothetical protein EYF80_067204 [Liparis tanakae]|uniref:Uncharacterized protein n=1 Tax=Liparis tanakae TaxID=230148 RepID=A0A4Z2E1N6_9TELE|nr:hypothetical protein EYF80_067204 [Liparis tanakae]
MTRIRSHVAKVSATTVSESAGCRLQVGHDTPTSPRETSCSCEREK